MEPFMFGGEQTFGSLGDKEAGSYFVKSRHFPQQTALLGMLKKELMTQAGLLTRKRRGEWVDKQKKQKAQELVGSEKFNMLSSSTQNFGAISSLSPLFLMQKQERFVKKVNIDAHPYAEGILKDYNPKVDIYDNYVSLESTTQYKASDIFKTVEQTGNKKGGEENSLFKKTSFALKDGFVFAFYAEVDYELQDSMVTLGADRSSFMMSVKVDDAKLDYVDPKGYLTLLSDAYISIPLKGNCDFAITSELSHRNLVVKKTALNNHKSEFKKSDTLYLYEKGSVFVAPSAALKANLDHVNLQQIGYNIYTEGNK